MKKLLVAAVLFFCLGASADTFDSLFKGKTTIKLSGTLQSELENMLKDPENYPLVIQKRREGISSALPVTETKTGVYSSDNMGEKIKYTLKNKKFQYKSNYSDLLWISVMNGEDVLEQDSPTKTKIKCTGSLSNVDPTLLKVYSFQIMEFASKEAFLYRKFKLEKVGKNLALKGAESGLKFSAKVTSKGKVKLSFSCNESYVRPEFTNP
ncbi:hypothetical protein IKS73_09430 [bacterium]|nr:hypothetical protein [bacterium]